MKSIENRNESYKGVVDTCYVLEDGTRVLSGNAMQNALNLQEEADNKSDTRLARYLGQKSLEPFIYRGKRLATMNL